MKKLILYFILFNICYHANGQIVINEVFVSNVSTNLDTKYYNYSGWVELYNNNTTDINLGNYYFSDIESDKTKWKLPPGLIKGNQFAIFWFNEHNISNHTSFKLNAKGSKIILYKNDGSVVDSVNYPKQYPNISFSRYPDGAENWNYCMIPTLKESNSDKRYSEFSSTPIFSQSGGIRYESFNLEITTATYGAEIRYTTNGSEPNRNSTIYSGPIPISKTTVIRAKVYEYEKLPSNIYTQTYIIPNRKLTLPVYSISTDPTNLWDNIQGIYVEGTNGIPGFCSNDPRNYNQDWERAINIEYYDSLGFQKINQYTGLKIAGNCSRGFPQKSFGIFPRNIYGKGKLKNQFFPDKPINEFDRLFLRNSGNDWGSAFLRDALFNELIKGKINIDYNAYQPSIVYLNGEYWGMLDTREKIDEDYILSNYNISTDDFDMIENQDNVYNGTYDNYQNFLGYVTSHDLNIKENYDYVKSQMDVDEYINYMILEIYIGNTDWPGNNLKYWKSKLPGGKWRWILYDLDFGYGVYDPNIKHNTLEFALEPNGPGWPNPPWSTELFRKMVTCNEFKNEFIKRFSNYLNTLFNPQRVVGIIDSMQSKIENEMNYHNQRWNGIWDWNGKVNFLREFATLRPGYVMQHIHSTFGLNRIYNLKIQSNIPGAYNLYIDNIIYEGEIFNGSFFNNFTVNINPVAKQGYKFIEWKKVSYNTQLENLINKGESWKFSDNGSLPAANWYSNSFDDIVWKQGNAQLGYGDGDENTVVSFGNDASNKYITTYFRKKFYAANVNKINALKLKLLVDDGAVIYLNNAEVLRYRMPSGTISNSTVANFGASNADETTFFEFDIPSNLLTEGENTMAVEVHQSASNSSDISFDMELISSAIIDITEEIIPGQNIDFTSNLNTELHAIFQENVNLPPVYINEILLDNQTGTTDSHGNRSSWIELYNSGNSDKDLGGLYISNDNNDKDLWQIPFGDPDLTTIKAKTYKAFWADGQPANGHLHLPFELNETGGKIYLFHIQDTDTTLIDSVSYKNQLADIAYGRYKDGTQAFYVLANPTFESSNAVPNQLPVFSSVPLIIAHSESNYVYNISASDSNNDQLSFNGLILPSWLTLSEQQNGKAILSGTPLRANQGHNPVSISVNDGKTTGGVLQLFTIQVQAPLGFESNDFVNWKIYPNPVKDYIQIVPESSNIEYSFRLCSLSGTVITEKQSISGKFQLNLSNLQKGMYFLITTTNGNSFITKLIKSD